ncbi:DUF4265 domain-containing protein [Leptospira interrogans]|uniref:DUF4265 domain-containing protein n=1 Tax=Leptospira interrogans TaxID=173 RepID=UPI0002BBAE6C|nr:DUF4265 domain-containing protein [Leptospira interrogans]MCR8648032.1 hypothetical protein [Leptospira interrogans serovar Bataviae]OAM75441.1 hypothetical protein A1343_07215 [Leptospira interrogans serovar Bataviae]QOI40731.1 DUF4265 domain-containing protein [Leptospira interrogans serovar Bataviae]QYY62601.1 DUF4265 domain-containing protein [Leptospira interrogans serovar Bataviae]
MTEHRKLRFNFENSGGSLETESIWVIANEEGYIIDNIPFYVKEIAIGDLVSATQDSNGHLWFSQLLKPSGHSTIQIWFSDISTLSEIRSKLSQLGCSSEISEIPQLIAVDIPPNVDYSIVQGFLEEGEKNGLFEYQEACLGFL